MILETEKLLDARLAKIREGTNTHFYLGFKECLGLFKISVRKSPLFNLHIENKRLNDENYELKNKIRKMEHIEEGVSGKKKFRSEFAKSVLAHVKKGNIDYATNMLENVIVK